MGLSNPLARCLMGSGLVWLLSAWMAMELIDGNVQEKAKWFAQAAASLGCGLLLYPQQGEKGHAVGVLAWCGLIAAGLFFQFAAFGMLNAASMKLVLGVFLLGLFMHSLVYAFPSPKETAAPILGFCLFASLAALPLWLGPWMEILADSHPLAGQVLFWLCPLSYLGSLFEYDFLREPWFYRNSPLGMLRYGYPDEILTSLALIAGSAWPLLKSRHSRLPANIRSLRSIEH